MWRLDTLEGVIDTVVAGLRDAEVISSDHAATPWESFFRLSDLVHAHYKIPSTTLTPVMRRLLFALGVASGPASLVGVGTYVGYAFTWLLRDRADLASGPFISEAIGIDIDAEATAVARRNCAWLNHGERLSLQTAEGAAALTRLRTPIDMLWIDIDDPVTGKSGYRRVLESAVPLLRTGSLVLAHDPNVPRFQRDFADYHEYIQSSAAFSGSWVLPVDHCGLALTRAS